AFRRAHDDAVVQGPGAVPGQARHPRRPVAARLAEGRRPLHPVGAALAPRSHFTRRLPHGPRFLAATLAAGPDRLPPGPADAVAGAVLVRGVRAEGLPGAGAAVRQVAGPAVAGRARAPGARCRAVADRGAAVLHRAPDDARHPRV